MNDTKDYQQLIELQSKFQPKAEEVFRTWASIEGKHFTGIARVKFSSNTFEVHYFTGCSYRACRACHSGEHSQSLPIEYLWSDTWAEELSQRIEEAKRELAHEKAMYMRLFGLR